MSRLATLKAATSLSDVAKLLDFKPKAVSYILYKQPAGTKYKTFQIPKRSGGQRTIKAPVDSLKLLQRRLSDLLQDCVDEINTARQRKDRTARGFKRKRSIITNARQHRHRRWVFNLDLEDFFPSINFGRVRGFLLKNRDFELHEDVATVVAQIACHENSLPQGSPCSPVISNLVAHVLDMRLVKLASESGCTYSRYADDLTFSTNKKEFPPEIAVPSATEGVGSPRHARIHRQYRVLQQDPDLGFFVGHEVIAREGLPPIPDLQHVLLGPGTRGHLRGGDRPRLSHVKNLYAVPTPLAAGLTSSKIEDLFDPTIKATVIDGKTFNDGDGFDVDKHFGKKVFAHRVVRPKADNIDFTAFRPLLTNLTAAINKHKASVAPQPPGP